MSKKKSTAEQIDQFAILAMRAGMAHSEMTRARRQARDMGVAGTTAREITTKRKFQDAQRKLWALSDRIDWVEAAREVKP